MGVNGFVLVALAAVLTTGLARTPILCPKRCHPECEVVQKDNGCVECICGAIEEPPRNPNDDPCPPACPQDCGQITQANGCLKCLCGPNPFVKPTRPPVKTDSICYNKCPADCRCSVVDGEAHCNCKLDPNHPFVKPSKVTLAPEIQCMPPLCEDPCYLYQEKGMICPGCKCPTTEPSTRRPPIFKCMPPLCEDPCYLYRDEGMVCPGCKCPNSEPITRRPPIIQCMPPLCEDPCYLYRDKGMRCPGCKCPPTSESSTVPPYECMPPQCEDPCYLFVEKANTCPICKCP